MHELPQNIVFCEKFVSRFGMYKDYRLRLQNVSRPSVSISRFKMFYEALLAGFWASVGSTLGKLSGTEAITGNSYAIWGILLIVMVVVNTWGCRHYLRSLDAASNSVAPTVISAASSYVLSGLIGIFLFEEGASFRWWSGALLIILGLSLVARPRNKQKPE